LASPWRWAAFVAAGLASIAGFGIAGILTPLRAARDWQRAAAETCPTVGIRMRGILDPIMKRLFALVVALAVVSAPVALEVCQITCESKGMPPSTSHSAEGHAAHHHMPANHASCQHTDSPPQLSPADGLCDHGTEATPSLVAARNSDTSVPLLATAPAFGSLTLVRTRDSISVRESAWSDRLGIPLAVPLRV
jgi:hypothetical protein